VLLAIVCTTIAGVVYSSLAPKWKLHHNETAPPSGPATTTGCGLRREWRTLSQFEKDHYISSVKCLTTIPSKIKSDWTSYEDFPWIHSHVGYYTHNSAPFLPWHRYFLHIYETTLREQCNFTGELVYWDWTLDWEHLEHSPIFDADSGFGGDGDKNGNITIGRTGRCVVDGPFTGIQAKYYDVKYKPHCLSRGFRDDEGNLGHMNGDAISPQSIEEVLQIGDYERFVAEMESRVHDAIPFGIGGDFETFTAPYGKNSSLFSACSLKS
jgi:tyrosinase